MPLLAQVIPPLPDWPVAHPAIVHVPIALLLVAPIFLIATLVFRPHARGLAVASSILLAIAAIGAFLATASGEASEDVVRIPAPAVDVLERHQEIGEMTRTCAVVLAGFFLAVVVCDGLRREKLPKWFFCAGVGISLAGSLAVLLMVANTAHLGGRLVHEFGARARIVTPPPEPPDDRD